MMLLKLILLTFQMLFTVDYFGGVFAATASTSPPSLDSTQSTSPDACLLERDRGPCAFRQKRWYWNSALRKCRRFHYGGCGGNANRFVDRVACVRRCRSRYGGVDGRTEGNKMVVEDKRLMMKRPECAKCDSRTMLCAKMAKGNFTCICKPGFVRKTERQCVDENECLTYRAKCSPNAWCENSIGSYRCICMAGYKGNGKQCEVNPAGPKWECERCHKHAECTAQGQCLCRSGYHGDGVHCEDVDECAEEPWRCAPEASCRNVPGSYICDCKPGFGGTGFSCSKDRSLCADSFDDAFRESCGLGNWKARYYYDKTIGSCRRFWYDGCNSTVGSRNLFSDPQTCQTMCIAAEADQTTDGGQANLVCKEPFNTDFLKACAGGDNWQRRYFFNSTSTRCEMFWFDGCKATGNNIFGQLLKCQWICELNFRAKVEMTEPERDPEGKTNSVVMGKVSAVVTNGKPASKHRKHGDEPHLRNGGHVNAFVESAKPIESAVGAYVKKQQHSFNRLPIMRASIAVAGDCLDAFDERHAKSCGGGLWEQRYFFNSDLRQCETFWYDQCRGEGKNIFADLDTCRWLCEGTHSRPEAGACLETFDDLYLQDCSNGLWEPRYYFDKESKQCLQFYYGGCVSKNRNIFLDISECESLCETPHRDLSRACLDYLDENYKLTCGGIHEIRYYFHHESGECRMFWFGHCRGESENIFEDLTTCRWLCERRRHAGPPRHCIDKFDDHYKDSCGVGDWERKYYFDHVTGTCQEFWYDGCKSSSENVFPDRRTCQWLCELPSPPYQPPSQGPDICLEDVEPGNCDGAYPSFYYDRYHGRCLPFSYTGCNGNQNRFLALQQCEQLCLMFSKVTSYDTDCLLPLDVGYGRQDTTCIYRAGYLYYYNRNYGKCGRFWYFGCGGNHNRFNSESECSIRCNQRQMQIIRTSVSNLGLHKANPEVCFQSVKAGSCRHIGNKPRKRFYYDANSKSCTKFTYNGCGGNENRFGTKQTCEASCGGFVRPVNLYCAHYPDWGPCNQLRWMWFYNLTLGTCQQFLWGGCDGNLNRFPTFEICQKNCEKAGVDICQEKKERGAWCEPMVNKYYYDQKIQKCKEFHYVGCAKSRNRFDTYQECNNFCIYRNVTLMDDTSAAGVSAGQYRGKKPKEMRVLKRHTVLNGEATSNGTKYLKADTVWADFNQCLGFRYNVSGAFTKLHAYLCLMEMKGSCVSETYTDTGGLEKCRIIRPWLKDQHLYSWFFTVEKQRKSHVNYPDVRFYANNDTVATVMVLGVNRCWDVC